MAFIIDTGPVADPARSLIPDWFWDTYPTDGTSSDRAIHDYGYHLIGALKNPAKMDTVRKHTLAQWQFLRLLAETHPGVFDEFMAAYAERVLA